MIRQEQLNQWLGDRQRKYVDGLVLFNALAKEAMKKKFAAYLAAAPEDPHIFDPHFTQLVNCLSKLDKKIKFSPSLYPAAMEEIVVVKTMSENDRKKTIESKQANIASLEELVNNLRSRIDSLENDSESHADELVSLQEQFDEKMSELSALQNEVNALNTPGVKIITEESLSPSIRKAYARIKEIAPLYASLHNDVANSEIPAEERQPIAEELCKLDDERHGIDLQYVVKGTERFGITSAEYAEPITEYKPDVTFYKAKKIKYVDSTPDTFFMFFPKNFHQALVKAGKEPEDIRVIVAKIEYIP